jgi:hypothetical protein
MTEQKHPRLDDTVIKNISFESRFGYMAFSIMKDEEGNCVMYKGSSPLCEETTSEVTFTVKSHDIYKEKNQTVIARMKVKK